MQKEYLDIVDENGNPTGEKELRSVVHEKGLRHRTVYVFLYKKDKEKLYFLTQHRSKKKDRHPNEWTIVFGGHVVSGTSIEQAIRNELSEEIGLEANDLILIPAGIDSYVSIGGKNKEFIYMFFCNYTGNIDNLVFNDGEVQALAWKETDEIRKEIKEFPNEWADTESRYKFYLELFKKYVTKKETS
jgi:isopentenyl-diphosphate Delta-isomerase